MIDGSAMAGAYLAMSFKGIGAETLVFIHGSEIMPILRGNKWRFKMGGELGCHEDLE
jgi:hypothetical protein